MKNAVYSILLVTGLTFSINVQAAPVLLGSIEHNYGKDTYVPKSISSNNSCDRAENDYLVIHNKNNCGRFYDNFDFSGLNYDLIDHFVLTVSFSHTNNGNWLSALLGNYESWHVRPAVSAQTPSDFSIALTRLGNNPNELSFVFNNTLDVFSQIVDAKNFSLWMAHEGLGQQNFRLYNASLDVFGFEPQATTNPVAVPAPAGIALFGLGLTLLGFARRNNRK